MKEYIKNHIKKSIEIVQIVHDDDLLIKKIEKVALAIIEAYKNERKVLVAGNGGSAADAQHICGELINRFYFDRPGLPCIALSTDTSVLTAIGNDYSFDKIFWKQIEANGKMGDVFIGISTSGNSKNIIEALKLCRERGIITVGLTGAKGGKMNEFCDHIIKIPSVETPRIQESHIIVYHIICAIVEESIFGKKKFKKWK